MAKPIEPVCKGTNVLQRQTLSSVQPGLQRGEHWYENSLELAQQQVRPLRGRGKVNERNEVKRKDWTEYLSDRVGISIF